MIDPIDFHQLKSVASIWELTPEQIDYLYRHHHVNNYVYAGFLATKQSLWPSGEIRRLKRGLYHLDIEKTVNRLLCLIPRLSMSAENRATRIQVVCDLFRFYRVLTNIEVNQVPQLMHLFASLSFLALVSERNDNFALWLHPPIRRIEPWQKRVFSMILNPFRYEDVLLIIREEVQRYGITLKDPLSIVFALTIRLVAVILVSIENGIFPEIAATAFQQVEAAMLDFEQRNQLGNNSEMPLNVKRPGQIRYRNTLYLYGGNHFERLGKHHQARQWYLSDIDTPQLPELLGFYLTALKTCERLLCAYRVSEPHQKEAILYLIDQSLTSSLTSLQNYAEQIVEIIENNADLDLSRAKLDYDGRSILFAGEPSREPLLIGLLYQHCVKNTPYSKIDYGNLERRST